MTTDPSRGGTQRAYTDILENQLEEGIMTLNRPKVGQFLSSLSCGFDIGFGPMMLLAMGTVIEPKLGAGFAKILMSLMYTLGFVFVILGRSELFTEHTTLAVLPVLNGEESLEKLGSLWGVVYTGNIVGGVFIAWFIAFFGPKMHIIEHAQVVEVATPFIEMTALGVFGGALLAGWLMGLLSWILTSVGDTISRVAVIILTTFVIGFGHLPHCVAGNIEVLAGIFSGASITYAQWAQFLAVTTVGNVVGGVVFVSLVKFGHVSFGAEEPDVTVEQDEGLGAETNVEKSVERESAEVDAEQADVDAEEADVNADEADVDTEEADVDADERR